MPSSMPIAIAGFVVLAVGLALLLTVSRVAAIVVLVISAVLLLTAKFRRSGELSEQRRAGRQ